MMDKAIVKTRLGHYWTPGAGAQTALVVGVDRVKETVNLSVWTEEAEKVRRLNVPVTMQFVDDLHEATFHLVSACMPPCPEFHS